MNRRAALQMLGGDAAFALQNQIAHDLSHHIGNMIDQRQVIQITLFQEPLGLPLPFRDNFLMSLLINRG
ncbi:MAG: hypothetical protein QM796_03045 [Chthoniobacteraceae bacterium]